ncbi:MAG TPA: DNA-3-methyladenine glycosylase [Candidatus Kapabacteria bacterium]|nr:DNA-3-methyladenine glycosylase [Candidatus Kapabacteria bacterium]HPO62657.1 DNA-3-methyladenine glycosylase [Candidatus Kapabacteria bacterium]
MISKFKPTFSNSIPKDFFLQKTEVVARLLLGKVLVKKEGNSFLAAMISETEAYLSENDYASHSAVGQTKRNSAMFLEGGILYVYKIYGVHHCINFVTEENGIGAAVLIRSAIPILGINEMKINRKTEKLENLCKGPGNLAKAYGFTLQDNFSSLQYEELFLQDFISFNDENIKITKRIGITKSSDLELRFLV